MSISESVHAIDSKMQGLTIAMIYSYESPAQLKRCVDSVSLEVAKIRSQVNDIHWILIRTPRAQGKDLSFYPGTVIESNTENLGFNRNLALQNAQTEGFYFVDPDCWLEPRALEILCQAFEKEKSNSQIFAFAGPNILKSENLILDSAFQWLGKLRFFNGGFSQIAVRSEDRLDWHSPTCHILYNLNRLQNASFSSQFEITGEDLEFHFRQSQEKKRILICSSSYVWHEQPRELFAYLKKCFKYGKAQTLLLKAQPMSFTNKRLLVLFASFLWMTLFLLLKTELRILLSGLTTVALVAGLAYEIIRYPGKKNYFSFPSLFMLIAGAYLLGQFSGLLLPLPKRQSEEPKPANKQIA